MEIELVRDGLRTAARVLGGLEMSGLDADGVRTAVEELRAVRTHAARLDVALATRATELRDTGTCEDAVDLFSGVGAMPAARARRVARHVELLSRMPALAAAFNTAAVSDDHVDAIAAARRRVDPAVRAEFDALDVELTAFSIANPPDRLVEHLGFVQRRLERDRSRDRDLVRRRQTRLGRWVDRNGMYQLRGSFDPETGARIFTAIDTAVEALRHADPGSLVPGEDRDDPLTTDREFLAAHALTRLVSHGHIAGHRGVAEIVVVIDQATLVDGDHDDTVCELHDGTAVDVDAVRRMCCEAMLTAVVVTRDGKQPLNAGRTIRVANREQRRALRAIHRSCAVDGCTTPFDWCEIHHIRWWENLGPTDIDNLVPLCLRHHHLVHDAGWRIVLRPLDRLLTLFRPDGTIHSQCRPPGLRPPCADTAAGRGTGPPGTASTTAA